MFFHQSETTLERERMLKGNAFSSKRNNFGKGEEVERKCFLIKAKHIWKGRGVTRERDVDTSYDLYNLFITSNTRGPLHWDTTTRLLSTRLHYNMTGQQRDNTTTRQHDVPDDKK